MGVNFLKYSLLRVGLMVLTFVLCIYLGVGIVLSALFAILIAFAISYLAFPRLHVAAGQQVQGWLASRRSKKSPQRTAQDEDTEIEDEIAEKNRRDQGLDF